MQKEGVQQTAIVLDAPNIEKWTRVSSASMKLTKKKKVRVTYRVAHKRLVRNNYVYNLGTI